MEHLRQDDMDDIDQHLDDLFDRVKDIPIPHLTPRPTPPQHPHDSPKPPPGDEGDRRTVPGDFSHDPNEKTGPSGFGESQFVTGDALLPYRIDFENDETATAPAQVVIIADNVSDDLDWTTLEFTEVGFGDQLIAIPEGLQYFETTVATTAHNGKEIEIRVEVGIELSIGQVYAVFETIDPTTQLPPDVTSGFLAPEDGSGRGQGHISYLIKPRADLPTGTEIRNIAEITFDFGETIATNQIDPHDPSQGTDPVKEALVTIDAMPPVSAVDAMPPAIRDSVISLTWTGEDDTDGSGIRAYDIYVSVDGGPYEAWLAQTTENSGIYPGRNRTILPLLQHRHGQRGSRREHTAQTRRGNNNR